MCISHKVVSTSTQQRPFKVIPSCFGSLLNKNLIGEYIYIYTASRVIIQKIYPDNIVTQENKQIKSNLV